MAGRIVKRGAVRLRARVWVEIEGKAGAALSDAGADLLEQIEVCGSLSEAARRLRYAYRRAWLLVDGMNRAWEEPVVKAATGGKRGGGAQLTEFGLRASGGVSGGAVARGACDR